MDINLKNALPRAVEILLVEDNPADVRLTQEGLKDAKVLNNLNVVIDGEAAIKYLKKEDEYKDSKTPDLILLDLNLPKKSGREVLADIKSDPTLKIIPVIILTTSDAQMDIEKSYMLGANSYITKPIDLQEFFRAISVLKDFFISIVKLPTINQ